MNPMGRKDFDAIRCTGCAQPGDHAHEPLALHARCHPRSPTWCWYDGGLLVVRCAKCETLVAKIWVGEAPPS